MFCPKCGARVPDTAKFCGKCGGKIDDDEEEEDAGASAASDSTEAGGEPGITPAVEDVDASMASAAASAADASAKPTGNKKLIAIVVAIVVAIGIMAVVVGPNMRANEEAQQMAKTSQQTLQKSDDELWEEAPSQITYINAAALVKSLSYGNTRSSGFQSKTSATDGLTYYLPSEKMLALKEGVTSRQDAPAVCQKYYDAADALIHALLYGGGSELVNVSDLEDRGLTKDQLKLLEGVPLYIYFNTYVKQDTGDDLSGIRNVVFFEIGSSFADVSEAIDAVLPISEEHRGDAPRLWASDSGEEPYIISRGTAGLVLTDPADRSVAIGYRTYQGTSGLSGQNDIVAIHAIGSLVLTYVNGSYSEYDTENITGQFYDRGTASIS